MEGWDLDFFGRLGYGPRDKHGAAKPMGRARVRGGGPWPGKARPKRAGHAGGERGMGPAARLAVDCAHGREDGGRRLTGRDLTRSSGPGAEVAATWSATRAGAKGEEEEEEEALGIGRPTTREAFRRAAANRSERPPPTARGGQGESV
uniref:Uncharacterized protein n=1 Tax=Oryza sativa subsp. japonica TaxID=39947 RepID=Q6Z483_ORYSJ|nr:hypothetical protein [Oryza sativa Japonica Group]